MQKVRLISYLFYSPMEGREIQDISIEADGTGEEDEVVVIND